MDPIFQNYELAVNFHPYQQEALDTLLARYRQGQQRLHLVAPPGAGKTLMGLELARRLQQRTVILSPTATIQQQWVRRFRELAVDLDALPELEGEQGQLAEIVGTDPQSEPAILSLTYQKVAVKGRGETGGTGLHDNVTALFETLAMAGYRTLILDECHHLLAHWAEAVRQFGAQLPEAVLVGLTATPPLGRAERELAVYLELIGPVDYEIPTPAVVREGHLAPYQDLVYLVRPTEAETRFVSGAHRDLHHLLQVFESGDWPCERLSFWAENWLLQPKNQRGEDLPRAEALSKMPDRTIACLRYLNQRGLIPLEAPWCPELEDAPELADLAQLLGAYGQEVLAVEATPHWQRLRRALAQLGYRFERGQFRLRQGAIDRVLALSAAKLRAVEAILLGEMAVMGGELGGELRCLILTDFETTHAPGRRAATQGVLDPEAGGALAVMRYLTSHAELDPLDPILVTGQTLLCDDDLLPVFLAEAERWFATHQLQVNLETEPVDGFVRLLGHGRDWTSAVYLGLVTDLLERGISRCLIGTRGLLGEGWDCKALNTLIDLTVVTSYVSVNQIRGRTLRQDPQRPLKVANNWDVVALMPELEGGFRDLERFQRKHAHFFGLSDDGRLEKGVGHVHPLFERLSRQALLADLETLNTEMLKRAAERNQAYERWEVGRAYRNRTLSALQIQWPQALPAVARQQLTAPVRLHELPVQIEQKAADLTLYLRRRQRQRQGAQVLIWGVGLSAFGLLGTVSGLGLASVWTGLWLLLAQGGFWRWQWRQSQQILLSSPSDTPIFFTALAEVLLRAFGDSELTGPEEAQAWPELSRRSDGSLRVSLSGASPSFAAEYVQALQECLEPLQEQRYLLAFEQRELQVQTKAWWTLPRLQRSAPETVYLPLPRYFARSRERAELFCRHFSAMIARAELIYTRQEAGRARLQQLQRQRALWSRQLAIEIWE